MRTVLAGMGFVLAMAMVFGACGGDAADTTGGAGQDGASSAATPPTKDAVIARLRDFLKTLQAEDYERAGTFLVDFPGMSDEARKQAVAGFIPKEEISDAGIDILAERGEFGPLKDVFPDDADRLAERAGVPVDRCYGILCGDAQVAVFQKGDSLLLFRLDDVGKLR